MNEYTDKFGPNVQMILAEEIRMIRGRIPAFIRKELMAAVKAGALGRLRKDGLKPEIFFHPNHEQDAIELQQREAAHGIKCLAKILHRDEEVHF